MRRPRSKLQVSTFPFLAVLLCAMGSLMLLLFIMDRRAKIAAKYRVSEELQARKKRTQAEEDARVAEWEKAKQQLHLSLEQQHAQLLAESKGIQQNLGGAGDKLTLIQARHGDLEQQVKGEAAKIGMLILDIESRRADLQQAQKKETMSKAELIEAAKELAELERAFQQLRALREREKQVHSVVPYRGKRGDMRPPIYVECVRQGVVFHPEDKVLLNRDLASDAMCAEVERRFGPLALQKTGKEKAEEAKGPYVLFLVRPEGIASYYKAQAALKGYQMDFGYELVDEGWVLDFSGDSYAKTAPPSRPQQPVTPELAPSLPLFAGNAGSNEGPLGSPLLPIQPPVGSSLRPGAIGGNTGPGNPLLAPPTGFKGSPFPGGNAPGPGAVGVNTGPGNPSLAPPIGFKGTPTPGANATGPGTASGTARPGMPQLDPPQGFAGSPPPAGTDVGTPNKSPAFVPITKTPPIFPTFQPGGSNPPGGANSPGGSNSPGSGATPNLDPINTPIPGNNAAGQRPPGGGTGSPGEPAESTGKTFPSAFGGDPGKKPPAAPPLSKLLGNRDFIVTIECRPDVVTVNPSGFTYRLTSSNLQETNKALVDTVSNLIARRQASVRPGEPPYRPLIRFAVSPDGLRSYYHVYPLLEPLRVPMTRENVEE